MTIFNSSAYNPSEFILVGFPGLEYAHIWIAFPLCLMYGFSFFGNGTIMYIVKTEERLHDPMYLFLAMLASIDILLYTTIMPKMLFCLWSNVMEISFNGCMIQMFFIHCLSGMETTVLAAMAFDRYIAICYPFQHTSILTNQRVAYVVLGSVIRGFILTFPVPFLIKRLPFCGSRVLSHSFCIHQDVMKLACAGTKPDIVYGLIAILLGSGIDSMLIFCSYVMILKIVCGLSKQERLKAFHTCISHLVAVLIFYIPKIGLSVVYRLHTSQAMRIAMCEIYLFVPPIVHPIVYGIKTTKIREKIVRWFKHTY